MESSCIFTVELSDDNETLNIEGKVSVRKLPIKDSAKWMQDVRSTVSGVKRHIPHTHTTQHLQYTREQKEFLLSCDEENVYQKYIEKYPTPKRTMGAIERTFYLLKSGKKKVGGASPFPYAFQTATDAVPAASGGGGGSPDTPQVDNAPETAPVPQNDPPKKIHPKNRKIPVETKPGRPSKNLPPLHAGDTVKHIGEPNSSHHGKIGKVLDVGKTTVCVKFDDGLTYIHPVWLEKIEG